MWLKALIFVRILLEEANGLEVTFHRAFDFVQDQQVALTTILKYEQITTILTAGGNGIATEFVSNLVALNDRTKNTHLTIMPGNGLRVNESDLWHYKQLGDQTGDHVWPMPVFDEQQV